MGRHRVLACVCLALITVASQSSATVRVVDGALELTIRTSLYTAIWEKPARMGLSDVTISETNKNAMSGGKLYHDLDYRGGRQDWGGVDDTEILIAGDNTALIAITSHDERELGYTVHLICWDSVPYFRVEVTATLDKGAEEAAWPITGYDPILSPGVGVDWDEVAHVGDIALSNDPLPHTVYWTPTTFLGLYAESDRAKARFGNWQANDTVIRLDHGRLAKNLQSKDSNTVAYYVGFGAGGEAEGHALAADIAAGTPVDPRAVAPRGKLRLTWADLKQ
ncbi:MAG: hypothetical protein ABGY41_19595 [Candidatus Poribacteria bacterium]